VAGHVQQLGRNTFRGLLVNHLEHGHLLARLLVGGGVGCLLIDVEQPGRL